MSARSGISNSIVASLIADITGSSPYITNLYGQIDNKTHHIDDVSSFPHVSVTPATEQRLDNPSNLSIHTVTINLRVYVNNEENSQEELEEIISDLELWLDTNQRLAYSTRTPGGEDTRYTIQNSISVITTDEGLLDPFGLGEISVDFQYEKDRRFL